MKIIKIGGNIIDDKQSLAVFAHFFANIPGPKILVHGGGKIASTLAEKLQIPVAMHRGRRITSAEMLDVATMVYAGLINKNIVALLQSVGVDAIGLSGADANTIVSKKRDNPLIDYGFVGDITKVDVGKVELFVNNGLVPVFCAITHDLKGNNLNSNADGIASELAKALAHKYNVDLYYVFELPGVLQNINSSDSLIKFMDFDIYSKMLQSNQISAGMIPKLDNAFASLQQGVKSVRICNVDHLSDFKSDCTLLMM